LQRLLQLQLRLPQILHLSQPLRLQAGRGQAGRGAGGQAGRRAGGQAGRREAGRRAGGQAGRHVSWHIKAGVGSGIGQLVNNSAAQTLQQLHRKGRQLSSAHISPNPSHINPPTRHAANIHTRQFTCA
jgi:hypothetical protein